MFVPIQAFPMDSTNSADYLSSGEIRSSQSFSAPADQVILEDVHDKVEDTGCRDS